MKRISWIMIVLLMMSFIVACGSTEDAGTDTGTADVAVDETSEEMESEEMEEESMDSEEMFPGFADWDAVLAAADGSEINWHMWGGGEKINAWVNGYLAEAVKEG